MICWQATSGWRLLNNIGPTQLLHTLGQRLPNVRMLSEYQPHQVLKRTPLNGIWLIAAFSCYIKVKVQVYSLISRRLKTSHQNFTFYALDLFIREQFQLHGEHTILHLRVKCLAQGHNIERMSQDWEGRNMIFRWKSCTQRGSKPHSKQRHRQSATL